MFSICPTTHGHFTLSNFKICELMLSSYTCSGQSEPQYCCSNILQRSTPTCRDIFTCYKNLSKVTLISGHYTPRPTNLIISADNPMSKWLILTKTYFSFKHPSYIEGKFPPVPHLIWNQIANSN